MRNMKNHGKNASVPSVNKKTCYFISFLWSPESLFTFVFLKWLPRQVWQIGGCFLQANVANTGPTWHVNAGIHCGKILPLSSFHKVQQQVPHLGSVQLCPVAFYTYGFHSWFLILYSGKNVVGAGLCLCIKLSCKHITFSKSEQHLPSGCFYDHCCTA